jgi:hypothetical protein
MADPEAINRSLALARAALSPPVAARARVRTNLGSLRSLGASKVSVIKSSGVTKLTTAVLVGLGMLGGYWLGAQRAADSSVRVARAPHESAPDTGASMRSAAEPAAMGSSLRLDKRTHDKGQDPSAAQAAPPRRASTRAVAAASADPQLEELALLQRAERAIRADRPQLALSFLDELEKRYPKSALIEERTAARVLADCASSEPAARQRAESFLSARQASVYSDRVRRWCGLGAAPVSPPRGDGSPSRGH